MNMMSSWHLVSSDYSLCASQIYISVCSFIALKNSSSLHSYFEFLCHYRVSESSYIDHHHIERCIEAFLCYFHNKFKQNQKQFTKLVFKTEFIFNIKFVFNISYQFELLISNYIVKAVKHFSS